MFKKSHLTLVLNDHFVPTLKIQHHRFARYIYTKFVKIHKKDLMSFPEAYRYLKGFIHMIPRPLCLLHKLLQSLASASYFLNKYLNGI